MKKNIVWVMIVFMLFSLLIGCDSSKISSKDAQSTPTVKNSDSTNAKPTDAESDTGTITMWGYEEFWKTHKESFEKSHPGIKIEYKNGDAYTDEEVLSLIASGQGPDIVYIDSNRMGKYNFTEALVDLMQEPYNAESMLDNFARYQLSWVKSLNGKSLYALPTVHLPAVAYYREDILKQYGFPSDPEELGDYMESLDNWVKMARELRKHDKFIMQYPSTPMDIYTMGTSIFDKDLNFTRNDDFYAKLLDISRTLASERISPDLGIWSENGKAAVKEGKIAMLYVGCWGTDILKDWAPDTKGKWRATRLPLGAYGVDGSKALAISNRSKHKKLAWELINKIVTRDKKDFDDKLNKTDEFLGGQKAEQLYAELREKIPNLISTPLDDRAKEIWTKGVNTILWNKDYSGDASKVIGEIEKNINDSLAEDKNIILETIKN